MMKSHYRLFLALLILCAGLIYAPAISHAEELTVAEILKDAASYDGKTIVFTGEVIGDVMRRGNYAWVNVYNGDDALGVWMKASFAEAIDHKGSYRTKGDIIECVGIFHRACPEHGADMDLHLQAMRKLVCGGPIKEELNTRKRNLIVFLLGVFAVIWIFTRSRYN
jgi:hypothetical protein